MPPSAALLPLLLPLLALGAAGALGKDAHSAHWTNVTQVSIAGGASHAALPAGYSVCFLTAFRSPSAAGCHVNGNSGRLEGSPGCGATCLRWDASWKASLNASLDGPGTVLLEEFGAPAGAANASCEVRVHGRDRYRVDREGGAACRAVRVEEPHPLYGVPDLVVGKREVAETLCFLQEVYSRDGVEASCALGITDKGKWSLEESHEGACRVSCRATECPCERGECVEKDDGSTSCVCDKGVTGDLCDRLVPDDNKATVTGLFVLVTIVAVLVAAAAFGRHRCTRGRGGGASDVPYAGVEEDGM